MPLSDVRSTSTLEDALRSDHGRTMGERGPSIGQVEFMPRPNQEYTARRFDSSHYDAGYECELPPEMRTELVGQRRRPIPPSVERSLPVKTTQPRGPLYFALLLRLIVLVGAL